MKAKIGLIGRLSLALLVLWAGWAGLGTLVNGWQFLAGGSPEPVRPGASVAQSPAPDPLPGGYWQFAGIPWGIDLAGVSTAAAPEPGELVRSTAAASPGGGFVVEPRFFEALRGLTWLGAVEKELPDGRRLWTLSNGQVQVGLLTTRDGDGSIRLLGGVFSRQQERGAWTTYALNPLPSIRPVAAGLIPDTAHPFRIAARHSASGEVLLEIAEIAEADFLQWWAPAVRDSERGLHEFDRRVIAGRNVRFLCGPVRPGEPALVVATSLPGDLPSMEMN